MNCYPGSAVVMQEGARGSGLHQFSGAKPRRLGRLKSDPPRNEGGWLEPTLEQAGNNPPSSFPFSHNVDRALEEVWGLGQAPAQWLSLPHLKQGPGGALEAGRLPCSGSLLPVWVSLIVAAGNWYLA